ncbi:hypothetical protein TNCV_1190111 [Trichonephila clavipes]|nr:hypothetical protein TNCV_1190111 [Trichonephila clavipes]
MLQHSTTPQHTPTDSLSDRLPDLLELSDLQDSRITYELPNVVITQTFTVPCLNCGDGDRWFAIYRPFGEFRRANSYCHLYGTEGQGQRQTYF